MATLRLPRSPFAVTVQVWRALFLREALMRLARDRTEWFWLIAEPVAHIAFLVWLFVVGFRQKVVVGADVSVFIFLGVLAFFLPRNLMTRSIRVVDRSEALYTYRQVKPVDTVIARLGLESVLYCVVFAVLWTGALLLQLPLQVADPLGALAALGALWLCAFGLGLVFSALASLHRVLFAIVRLAHRPLYLFSAVLYPSAKFPPAVRDWLMYNPLLHGVESFRAACLTTYHVPVAVNLTYLLGCSVAIIFLGLALHLRFEDRLAAR